MCPSTSELQVFLLLKFPKIFDLLLVQMGRIQQIKEDIHRFQFPILN